MKGRLEHQLNAEQSIELRLAEAPPILTNYYYYLHTKEYKTKDLYFTYVRRFLMEVNKDIKDITQNDIDLFLTKLIKRKDGSGYNTDTYRATYWSALNSFFTFCVDSAELITKNPLKGSKRPQVKRADEVKRCVLTANDLNVVYSNINSMTDGDSLFKRMEQSRDTLIIRMLERTGLRVTALTEINLNDIDYDEMKIHTVNKRRKELEIPLPNSALPYLWDWLEVREEFLAGEDCDALFISSHKKRISQATVSKIVKKYTYNIANKNITPHKFRGTFATNLYNASGDIKYVKECLGHSNISTTQIYIQEDKMKQRRRADAMLDAVYKKQMGEN